VKELREAHVLNKDEPLLSRKGPASSFRARLVGHCYVLLENFRVLNEDELKSLQD
jgi:hypothetical protein